MDEPSRTFRQESFLNYLPFGFLFSALRCRLQDLKGSAFSIIGHRLFPVLRNHRHRPLSFWFCCRLNSCDCSATDNPTGIVTDCIVRDKHVVAVAACLRSQRRHKVNCSVLRNRQAGDSAIRALIHRNSVYFGNPFAGLSGSCDRAARLDGCEDGIVLAQEGDCVRCAVDDFHFVLLLFCFRFRSVLFSFPAGFGCVSYAFQTVTIWTISSSRIVSVPIVSKVTATFALRGAT